jgi:predicted ATPase/DNA-binding XRE family transcriptional regulator
VRRLLPCPHIFGAGCVEKTWGSGLRMSEERATTFGARLRSLREGAGLSREELASRAGLTAKGIGALERGERKRPYPHTVRSLADALELTGVERDAFVDAAPRRTGMAFTTTVESVEPTPTLPMPPTPIIGREQDAAKVRSLLEGDGARLVTLTGPGGVGKTRLALEVSGRVRDRFPEGVALVALAPVGDPTLLLPTVAQVLGLREAGGRSARELLHGYLKERRLLLLLDNFEHLLAAAPEVAALLASCPSLKVLATSRAPLRLRGEQEYPVEPLPVPDLSRVPTPGDVEGVPSVRLLVERAREASPGFGLTQQNAAALAAICRRLDGLPLALELVAARLKLLPPTALLARLDAALPLLSGGPRDLPERQRTMQNTVAWSYDLLGPGEQTLFGRLAVFAGGFELPAAEAVGGDAVLEGLSALLENSLVRPDVRPPGGDAEPRFTMLETVRAYGLERLAASGEEEEVRGGTPATTWRSRRRRTPSSRGAGRRRGWTASNASTTTSGLPWGGCWSTAGRGAPRGLPRRPGCSGPCAATPARGSCGWSGRWLRASSRAAPGRRRSPRYRCCSSRRAR